MNSPEVQEAIEATFKKMMSWPKWYFHFHIWRHWHFCKHHWITDVLQETGYFERIAEENRKRKSIPDPQEGKDA